MKKIAPDKWKHFYAGIVMGAILQVFFWWILPAHHIWATAGALIMVMAISYGFELFSLITGLGYYEVLDAVAGILGGIIGIGVVLLVKAYVIR